MEASQQSTDLKGTMPARTSGNAGSGAPAVAKQPPTSKPPAPPSSLATGSEADTPSGKRSPSVLFTPEFDNVSHCSVSFAHLGNEWLRIGQVLVQFLHSPISFLRGRFERGAACENFLVQRHGGGWRNHGHSCSSHHTVLSVFVWVFLCRCSTSSFAIIAKSFFLPVWELRA